MSRFIIKKVTLASGKVEYSLHRKTFWGNAGESLELFSQIRDNLELERRKDAKYKLAYHMCFEKVGKVTSEIRVLESSVKFHTEEPPYVKLMKKQLVTYPTLNELKTERLISGEEDK